MPKIIGFFGSAPADLCMYAAYALQNIGKRVCVVDNSEDGSLFRCIPTPDERLRAVTYRNVDFMRWYPLADWHALDDEYVLVQLGAMPQQLCLALCSERILVTDCERANLDAYSRYLTQCCMPVTVLLRGFCWNWVIAEQIKAYAAKDSSFIERWLFLPYDPTDEAYRIEMQYGKLYQFSQISTGMERVLAKLLQLLEICDRIRLVRAINDAKRGKTAAVTDTRGIAG